jgi:uncharacterized membrane protein YgdD (TMEM256/DUF423 family)
MKKQTILRTAAALGFAGVAIGAFAAHGLKPRLDPYQIQIFEKGVQYHFIHTLALGWVGLLAGQRAQVGRLRWAYWLFVAGIACFSGSLYLLATRDLLPFSVAWAGPITPLGGLCFLGGWGVLLLNADET